MPFLDRLKSQLDRRSLRFLLTIAANHLAFMARHGVQRSFYDDGIWIHQTVHGYFAYHHPYIRLNMEVLDTWARTVFLQNYQPNPGDVILDIGAGAGEEVLTFSRAVGQNGRVICVEAHPRTFRCLQKLVEYNRLENVILVHCAVSEPGCTETLIQDCPEYLRNRVGTTTGVRNNANPFPQDEHRRCRAACYPGNDRNSSANANSLYLLSRFLGRHLR
jgi:Protein-L-isoaspartate(D-aspartate) O-methyltransferase (PCMT)